MMYRRVFRKVRCACTACRLSAAGCPLSRSRQARKPDWCTKAAGRGRIHIIGVI